MQQIELSFVFIHKNLIDLLAQQLKYKEYLYKQNITVHTYGFFVDKPFF